jgi:16S rRNA (cytosine1402-N4)-methyltransferase
MDSDYHIPVMSEECISALNLKAGQTVVDATVGGAGHSRQIAKKIPGGTLVCIDQDIAAIEHSQLCLQGINAKFIHANYADIASVLDEKVDAIFADLGVSNHQIDTAERGFSYMAEGELDMRMNRTGKLSAYHVVNMYPTDKLFATIRDFGEERYAGRITQAIVKARPVKTTLELAEVIKSAVPGSYYKTGGHPAKRTFQAIRIEVNNELVLLEKFIRDGVKLLKKGGRIAIITFHSLEDRIVKQTFKKLATDCLCPPRTPICICGHKASVRILTKKPIEPTEAEQKDNPRSHSAKLRVAEKI